MHLTPLLTFFFTKKSPFSNKNDPKWMFWKRRRHVVALMAFLGFFNMYALRVNLSIAIVAMVQIHKEELDNGTIITVSA